MVDARPQEIVNELRQLLEDEITDLNSDRAGDGRWVYTIPINYGIAEYPRIHISQVSAPHAGYSIGSTEREADTQVQISIFNHVDSKFDINDDGQKETSNEVIDFLAQRVIDLVNDNNEDKWQKFDNVHYMITQDENLVQDTGNEVLQYNITAELRSVR